MNRKHGRSRTGKVLGSRVDFREQRRVAQSRLLGLGLDIESLRWEGKALSPKNGACLCLLSQRPWVHPASFPDASSDSRSCAVSRLSLACLEGRDHSHLTLETSRGKVQLQLLSSAAAGKTPWRYCVTRRWATWMSLTHLKLIVGKSQISGDSNQIMV